MSDRLEGGMDVQEGEVSFTGKTALSDGGCGGGKTDDRGQNGTEERGTTTEERRRPRNVNFIDARRGPGSDVTATLNVFETIRIIFSN